MGVKDALKSGGEVIDEWLELLLPWLIAAMTIMIPLVALAAIVWKLSR